MEVLCCTADGLFAEVSRSWSGANLRDRDELLCAYGLLVEVILLHMMCSVFIVELLLFERTAAAAAAGVCTCS